MWHQESSFVVSRPLAEVEARIRQVESWPRFMAGLDTVTRRGHERYQFQLTGGGGPEGRQATVLVRADVRRHELRWRSLGGPRFAGCFRMTEVQPRHTKVALAISRHPRRMRSGLLELMALRRSETAAIDVSALDRYLSGTATTPGATAAREP